MVSFTWTLLSGTYIIEDNKPVIVLFGKTDEDKQIILFDYYNPYLWIVPEKGILIEQIKELADDNIAIKEITEAKKDVNGKEHSVFKVSVEIPAMIPVLRRKCEALGMQYREADILFIRRYMIDKKLFPGKWYEIDAKEQSHKPYNGFMIEKVNPVEKESAVPLKTIAFDIETVLESGMLKEDMPIVMISVFGDDVEKVFTWNHGIKHNAIDSYDNEKEMLEAFVSFIKNYKPDVITGYFSDGFDFPHLLIRSKNLGVPFSIGVDGSIPKKGRGRAEEVTITGMNHVDMHQVATRLLRNSLQTDQYSLDAVASELLGDEKVKEEIADLAKVWKDNDTDRLASFAEYNLHDSRLCYQLFQHVLPQILEMSLIIGLPLSDTVRMATSQLVEKFLIKHAPEYNALVPNKPAHDDVKMRQQQRFKGGFVYNPEPGIYEPILIFDFLSLYPTIIMSLNISPGTFMCSCCKNTKKVPLEGKDYWFCQKQKGFLPIMIEDLFKKRIAVKKQLKNEKDEIKKQFLNSRQLGLKVVANSFYGYLGFFAARWYSLESAESTTAYGRFYIQDVLKKMNAHGYKVLYSDTDSIFITTEPEKKQGVYDLVKQINHNLPGIMELEFEGEFPRGIFVSAKESLTGAKKKYALIDKENNLVIKGFTSIRRNASFLAKEAQKEVLRIILAEKDVKKAFDYVTDIISKVRHHKIDKDKMIIRTQLTRPIEEYTVIGPHVAVATAMMKKGIPVTPHTIIPYIITKEGNKIRDKARFFENCSQEDYDDDYYIQNQLIPAVESIFSVCGYDKANLAMGNEQHKLDSFF